MSAELLVPPPVLWAQRRLEVFLTISIECKEPDIKIEAESVYFKGVNAQDKKVNEVTIALFDKIVPEKSSFVNKGRCIEIVLIKENSFSTFWPSLTKDVKKPHYLKIDFNKWVDEDDDHTEGGESAFDLSNMIRSLGTSGGDGGDLDGKGDKMSMESLDTDSDDENLPDLE